MSSCTSDDSWHLENAPSLRTAPQVWPSWVSALSGWCPALLPQLLGNSDACWVCSHNPILWQILQTFYLIIFFSSVAGIGKTTNHFPFFGSDHTPEKSEPSKCWYLSQHVPRQEHGTGGKQPEKPRPCVWGGCFGVKFCFHVLHTWRPSRPPPRDTCEWQRQKKTSTTFGFDSFIKSSDTTLQTL